MGRIFRFALWVVAVLLLLLLLLSGMAFVHGSLELFPTEEQQDKARLFFGSAFVLFALLELVAVAALWLTRPVRWPPPKRLSPRAYPPSSSDGDVLGS
jgi:lysylphosphatidylglycerol synthetase-like protein (DUF2156 family)